MAANQNPQGETPEGRQTGQGDPKNSPTSVASGIPEPRTFLNQYLGKCWHGTVNGAPAEGIWLDPAGFPDTFEMRLKVSEAVEMLRARDRDVLRAAADLVEACDVHGTGGSLNSYEQRGTATRIANELRALAEGKEQP